MNANTKKKYAADGFEVSARDVDKVARTTTIYLRGHSQWVKIIRQPSTREWLFYRGYKDVIGSHERQRWAIKHMPTWDNALEHAAQMIRDHK